MSNNNLAILEWYVANGVDEAMAMEPIDRFVQNNTTPQASSRQSTAISVPPMSNAHVPPPVLSTEKVDLSHVKTLEDLEQAIKDYDGIGLKRSAKNCVFADGNPKAHVMIIGDSPGADEDRQGIPFIGTEGKLLDKILAAIHLDRTEDNFEKSVYISNIINWRPPGNRTPTEQEIELSIPFIEKHIALVQPKVIVLAGGMTAKTLLRTDKSMSKLRGEFHDYTPETLDDISPIPALATYHPTYLLRNPIQKRAVWRDMLCLNAFLKR